MHIEDIIQIMREFSDSRLEEFLYEEGSVRLQLAAGGTKAATSSQTVCAEMSDAETAGTETARQIAVGGAGGADKEYIVPVVKAGHTSAAIGTPSDLSAGNAGIPDVSASDNSQKSSIRSPLVGTFYSAPGEQQEPFVRVGDRVQKGQVVAIVEAMKLMNEIESDVDGTISEILVKNEEPVEYGQPLFTVV